MPEHLRGVFTFDAADDVDFLVVYDGLSRSVATRLPLERRLAILPEPPFPMVLSPNILKHWVESLRSQGTYA